MNSNDYMDQDNARNQAVAQLIEICMAMGLNSTATQDQFIIQLPNMIVRKAVIGITIPLLPTKRKTFDISTWGDKGPVEGLPDDMQFPDYGEILDEGVPPQGDPNHEA